MNPKEREISSEKSSRLSGKTPKNKVEAAVKVSTVRKTGDSLTAAVS